MHAFRIVLSGLSGIALAMAQPALAQVQAIDPNTSLNNQPIDGDLPKAAGSAASGSSSAATVTEIGTTPALPADPQVRPSVDATAPAPAPTANGGTTQATAFSCNAPPRTQVASTSGGAQARATYREDDLVGAAEGVFGSGAKGLAAMIHDLLAKQGEPNAYITGREAGGAIAVGLRYGSGTMCHRIEGKRPVYWAGPSIGFDAGASGGSTFVLVYNLFDSEDLFKRFGAGEGQAYLVGGFNVSYLRKGDVVLIPIRMGVGLRLGVNGGYMKFSRKQNWFPF